VTPIYLDYNATTPLAPEARAEMVACLDECIGNPSSVRSSGLRRSGPLRRWEVESSARSLEERCHVEP